MTAQDTGFTASLVLPGNWIDFDPSVHDEASLDALVGDRFDAIPELAAHREEILTGAARTLERGRNEGVLQTAFLADVRADRDPVIASLAVVAVAGAPPDPDMPAVSMETLAATFTELEPEVHVDQREVTTVLLPGGPAVRIVRIVDLPLSENGPVLTALTVQYFFMIPDTDQFVVLSFASPTVGAHRELQLMWHEIAGSFELSEDVAADASPNVA